MTHIIEPGFPADAHAAGRARCHALPSPFRLPRQTIGIGVLGAGKVGSALIAQISAAQPRLLRGSNLDLRLCTIANSRRMCLEGEYDPSAWRERLACGKALDLDRFAAQVRPADGAHAIIVDCTASPAITDRYAGWLGAGIHIVTPNKHAGSGDPARWRAIRNAAAAGGARFRYEATVGAGLPVIQTLRDLLDTGDELRAIDGILSGTLAWLFNRYDGSLPFSALVREAHALGYTEPDPRDDLAGTDVARKLVILAREAGRDLSLADVAVEGLVPPTLQGLSHADFLAVLPALDEAIATRHALAHAAGRVLRYVARLDAQGRARVGLVDLPASHPFAHLRLTDNIVQFTTRRYCDNPLIVQGPGAGPEVTAAGVFADLLRVAACLGAAV